MAGVDETQSPLEALDPNVALSPHSASELHALPEWGDEKSMQCIRNIIELNRRFARLPPRENLDTKATIKTMQDTLFFYENPDMELPRAFDADELEARPFVEPMPIIYPPHDWASKKHSRWDYSELPTSTSIRLLKLDLLQDYEVHVSDHGQDLKRYSPIRCTMDVVDLADKPDFFALSYTWGDPRTIYTDKSEILPPAAWHAPSFEIDCAGKPVTVTANLYTALSALRAVWSDGGFVMDWGPYFVPQEHTEKVYIWVDQLCINQDNIAEKNIQVPMMDRIYQEARSTIMWLGGGEKLTTAGTKNMFLGVKPVIQHFRDLLDPRDEDHTNSSDSSIWRNSELVRNACSAFDLRKKESYTDLGLEPVEPEELIGWYLLLSRSWFDRAWIVQEWALSEECIFLCGGMSFSPRAVMDIMQHFSASGWFSQIEKLARENILDSDTDGLPSWNETPTPFHRALHAPTWGGEPRETMPTLYQSSWNNIDPFDKQRSTVLNHIHAIRWQMGFDEMSGCSIEMRKEILGDLKFSLETLRPTQATDPRDKVFAFYSLFKDDDGKPIYPSPDYTKSVRQVYIEAALAMAKQFGPRFLGFLGCNDYASSEHNLPSWVPDLSQNTSGAMQFGRTGGDVYNASSGVTPPTSVDFLEWRILQLSGCLVDTIIQVQEEPLGACDLVYGFREFHQMLCLLPELSDIGTPDGGIQQQSRYEVYWRTKIHNCQERHAIYPAPAELGDIHLRRLKRFLTGEVIYALLRTVKDNIDEVLEEAGRSTRHNGFLSECLGKFTSPESDDYWIKAHCEELIETEYAELNTGKAFDSHNHAQRIVVINTYLAMLKGDVSFDDYAGLVPDMWAECEEAFEDLARARQSRDYVLFKNSLSHMLYELPKTLMDAEQGYADMLKRDFRDNDHLFATQYGRLGQNPGGAEVGDEIWVLAGLHAPIILRRLENGGRRIVGCAYVHGIMHGEAVVGEATENVYLV